MTAESNHSKSSNVIKIFNPMYSGSQDTKEGQPTKMSNDPKKEGDHKYEYSSEPLQEKQEYLRKDNPS